MRMVKISPYIGAILITLTLLSLFSCEDKEDPYLSFSKNLIELSIKGKTETVTVSSNGQWFIRQTVDWVSIDHPSGDGNSSVAITIEDNTEQEDRSTTLFMTSGSVSDTLLIIQQGDYLRMDIHELTFDYEGTPLEIHIETPYVWRIQKDESASWCNVDQRRGTGDTTLVFTPTSYTVREPRRNGVIEIHCNDVVYRILVHQEIENESPAAPELMYPLDESEESGIYPLFVWYPSEDPDGDPVYYELQVSTDISITDPVWTTLSSRIIANEFLLSWRRLSENTLYYWRVIASDDFGGSAESNVLTFTSGVNIIYDDGEILPYQSATIARAEPVRLVVLGDGFVRTDYGKGSLFEIMADQGIESFFAVEPFKTYRDYFTVDKIVTYSGESGATVLRNFRNYDVPAQTVETVFESVLDGGTSTRVTCNTDYVFQYVQEKLELTDEELNETTILLIINLDVYAGTTAMSVDGASIAMCPTGRESFTGIVQHELGGHGFGRLADEYITAPYSIITSEAVETVENFRQGDPWRFGANLTLSNDASEVHWKHYFTEPGYEVVDLFAGGLGYGRGVWRAEEYCCMMDNIPYFSAPSREAIVRRIMQISGRSFDYISFYTKDMERGWEPPETKSARTVRSSKPHLGEPILLK